MASSVGYSRADSSEQVRPSFSPGMRAGSQQTSEEFRGFVSVKVAPALIDTIPEGERVFSVQRVSDKVAKNHLRLNALFNVALVAAIVSCSLLLPWVEFP